MSMAMVPRLGDFNLHRLSLQLSIDNSNNSDNSDNSENSNNSDNSDNSENSDNSTNPEHHQLR
jgi:hypothetical protein